MNRKEDKQSGIPVVNHAFAPLVPSRKSDDRSSYAYRQLIGYLGLLFPFVVLFFAHWRRMPELGRCTVLPSVSAYYYTGAVPVFVGILVALGLFLVTYKGYKNNYGKRDRIASRIAGGAAILVALFPTEAPLKSLEPGWWRAMTGTVHFSAATVLFFCFAYISLFLFTRTKADARVKLLTDKGVRNSIYILCGSLMVVCIVWAGLATKWGRPIFLPESIALEAFALSWLTKGRADKAAAGIARRVWHYGRHPSEAVERLYKAVRG